MLYIYYTHCLYGRVHISNDKSLRNLLTVVRLFRIFTGYCLAYDWTGKGNERLSDDKSLNRMLLYQHNKTYKKMQQIYNFKQIATYIVTS